MRKNCPRPRVRASFLVDEEKFNLLLRLIQLAVVEQMSQQWLKSWQKSRSPTRKNLKLWIWQVMKVVARPKYPASFLGGKAPEEKAGLSLRVRSLFRLIHLSRRLLQMIWREKLKQKKRMAKMNPSRSC